MKALWFAPALGLILFVWGAAPFAVNAAWELQLGALGVKPGGSIDLPWIMLFTSTALTLALLLASSFGFFGRDFRWIPLGIAICCAVWAWYILHSFFMASQRFLERGYGSLDGDANRVIDEAAFWRITWLTSLGYLIFVLGSVATAAVCSLRGLERGATRFQRH